MADRADRVAYIALAGAILALAISITAYAARRASQPQPARSPATMVLSMVVAEFTGQGMTAHRWFPTMLMVRQGDTVELAVANPDQFAHQLEITGYDLRTRRLTPGSSEQLQFTADHPGVFAYRCVLAHDPAKGDCTPDHTQMIGYMIVTE